MKHFFLFLMLIGSITILPMVSAQECDLDNAGALAERARTHSNNDEHEAAIADYTCAIELVPDEVSYYNSRGIAYDDLQDYDSALVDYERALEINPEYAYAYNNRGNIFYSRGNYERAVEDYNRSLELDNEQPEIPYFNRGNAYYELGDYEQAAADLTLSIENDPEYARAFLSRAWTYLVLGDDRAHADFEQWIRLSQTDVTEFVLDGTVDGEVFSMTEGMVYEFKFVAEAGLEINISAEVAGDFGVDPLIVLLDPNGGAVAADDDSGLNLDAIIPNFVIPQEGLYTLLVSHARGGTEGDIRVTIDLGGEVVATFSTYTLLVNEKAEVYTVGGDSLNLRMGPGLNFEIAEKLERGTLVTLLEGPRKADGFAWWRVRTEDGIEGWAVERADDEQTLQLALLVGENALVTSGEDTLNVRDGAGRSFDVVIQLEDGALVELLEVPQIADNFRWWHIRTVDGQEGWTVDRVGSDRMLIPEKERGRG